MSHENDLERRLTDLYASEGALRAPDRVLSASLATIDATQQRRVFGVPWRFPQMNTYARLAVAGAAVIAVVAVGLYFLSGNQPAVGGPPPASPSPSPTPIPTLPPTPSPTASAVTEVTQRFTSNIYGLSVSYPAGWATRPAATALLPGDPPTFEGTGLDLMYDRSLIDHLFIGAYSQPLDGVAGGDWMTSHFNGWGCSGTISVTIDGEAGQIGEACDENVAVVTAHGRGYLVWLHTSPDNPELPTTYTAAWFRDVLGTIDLNPSAAQPSPSVSP